MDLNIDAYVAELRAERDALKAENKSLNEALSAKEKELLQSQFKESAEMKKINEAYAPFKKMGVSAKTLNETLKKAQENLKKEKATNSKLVEELNSYKTKCGSVSEVNDAIKYSTKALRMIEEYQAIGTPEEFRAAKENLNKLKAYESIGTVRDLRSCTRMMEKVLPALKKQKQTQKELKEAKASVKKALKVIKTLHEIAEKTEKLLPQLREAKKLEANSGRLISELKESRILAKNAEKALHLLEEYKTTYGDITPKVNVKNQAVKLSEKYGCTIESAAKLINKHGLNEATKLVESALSKKQDKDVKGLESGKKIVEDLSKLDEVKDMPAEKTAEDFLREGVLKNYFNNEALGKQMVCPDLNKIEDGKAQKLDAAKELLKKYRGDFEVADKPEGVNDKEVTPDEAEDTIKKLLRK